MTGPACCGTWSLAHSLPHALYRPACLSLCLQIVNAGAAAGFGASRWVYLGSEAAGISLAELRLLGGGHVRIMPYAPDYDWPGANSSVVTVQRISSDGTGMISSLNRTVLAIIASPSGGSIMQGAMELDAMQLQLLPVAGSSNEYATIYRRRFLMDDASQSLLTVPITTAAGSLLVIPPRVVISAALDIAGGFIGAKTVSILSASGSLTFRATAGSRLVTEGLPMEMASYVPGELLIENLYMKSATLNVLASTTITGYNLTFVSSTVNVPTGANITARYLEFSGGTRLTLGANATVNAVNRTWPGMAPSNPNYGWDVPGGMMIDGQVTMNDGGTLYASNTMWLRNTASLKVYGVTTLATEGSFYSFPSVVVDGAGGGYKDGFGPGSRREFGFLMHSLSASGSLRLHLFAVATVHSKWHRPLAS